MNNIFCVDIGGSKLICGVLNTQGEIIKTVRADYPREYDLNTIVDLIKQGYDELKEYSCTACAVAVPGLCDSKNGVWSYSPFSGLSDIPINDIVSKITALPTMCDNDVNLSALAENILVFVKTKPIFCG